MKNMNASLADTLSAGSVTLCLCWLFTRVDGARFGATDHDRDLVVDGVECLSQSGLAGATFQTGMDLAPGQAGMRGALSAEFLDDADLDAGLWDGARLDVYRVDWSSPQDRMHVWSGRLSEVIRNGDAFSAELVSLKADLERRIGQKGRAGLRAVAGDRLQRLGVTRHRRRCRKGHRQSQRRSAHREQPPSAVGRPSHDSHLAHPHTHRPSHPRTVAIVSADP